MIGRQPDDWTEAEVCMLEQGDEASKILVLSFPADKNVYYCGDIHGCYDLLMEKLDSVGFNKEEDALICTGDLIDRGSQNIECLELMSEPWFYTVRGNHEDMAYKAITNPSDDNAWGLWYLNGGVWYTKYGGTDELLHVKDLILKTNELPDIIEVNHGTQRVVVCHADYPASEYPAENIDDAEVIWSRERYYLHYDSDCSERIFGADHFVFGHTPVDMVTRVQNQIYIDTGAVFTEELTIIQL